MSEYNGYRTWTVDLVGAGGGAVDGAGGSGGGNESLNIVYKFRENEILAEAWQYINTTYKEHYAEKNGIQALDFIMANSDDIGFLKGNAIKYAARYGKKEGFNKKDIYKAIHYLVLLYHFTQPETDNK